MFEDFVSDVLPIIVVVLVLALIGVLMALVVLIPPIRKLGRRSGIARAAVIVVVGVVSLAASFGLFTRLGAEVAYIVSFYIVDAPPQQEVEDPLRPAIVTELWVRGLVPPPLRQSCYTTDMAVCQRADRARPGGESSGDLGLYLRDVGFCMVSSLAGGSLAWAFTRPRRGGA